MARNNLSLLATALLVLAVTASLPEPAAAWTFNWATINYYLFHPSELLKLYFKFTVPLVRPVVTVIYNFLARVLGYIAHPIDSLAKLNKWKKALIHMIKTRITDRNPYARCAKIGYPKCWKKMRGVNWFSTVFCPMAIYWECNWSWRFGRRGAGEAKPYWEDYSTGYEGSREDPSWGPRKPVPTLPKQSPVGKGRCLPKPGGHCPPPPHPRMQQQPTHY